MKQPFYKKYRLKKFKRMALLDEHGVRDIRELEFAGLVIQVYEKLKDVAKIARLSHDLILSTTTGIVRQNNRIYSLLTKQEIASRAKSLLSLYTELMKLKRKELSKSEKMSPKEIEIAINVIKEQLKERLTEEHNLMQIYSKYMKIE